MSYIIKILDNDSTAIEELNENIKIINENSPEYFVLDSYKKIFSSMYQFVKEHKWQAVGAAGVTAITSLLSRKMQKINKRTNAKVKEILEQEKRSNNQNPNKFVDDLIKESEEKFKDSPLNMSNEELEKRLKGIEETYNMQYKDARKNLQNTHPDIYKDIEQSENDDYMRNVRREIDDMEKEMNKPGSDDIR